MGGDGAFWGPEKGTSGMEVNMSCGMGPCGRDRCCWRLRRRSLGGSAVAADLPAALDVGWNRGVDKSGMGKTAVFVLSTLQQLETSAGGEKKAEVKVLVLCHGKKQCVLRKWKIGPISEVENQCMW